MRREDLTKGERTMFTLGEYLISVNSEHVVATKQLVTDDFQTIASSIVLTVGKDEDALDAFRRMSDLLGFPSVGE